MNRKKAAMGLEEALKGTEVETEKVVSISASRPKVRQKDKKQVPIYYHPKLHDALQTIVFAERHKKTSINSLVLEGLDLLFKERGYPSIEEISSGEKRINI
ncbi:MAG: hypothetical protein ACE5FY_07285 [Nitrospiria bacterium]